MHANSISLESCNNLCQHVHGKKLKLTFMDKLIGRTIDEKVGIHCHIHCIDALNAPNYKRNGRWGFVLLMGFTEFFSSLFAFISFIFNFVLFRRKILPKLHRSKIRFPLLLQHYISNTALLSSTLFHMRETPFTKYSDYFSAFMSIQIGLINSLGRLVMCTNPGNIHRIVKVSLVVNSIHFFVHLYIMLFIEFHKKYNKITCGTILGLQILFDFCVFLLKPNHCYSKHILYYIGTVFAAGFAELQDLPPVLYVFDSHAMWHLIMIMIVFPYINFISEFLDSEKYFLCTSGEAISSDNDCGLIGEDAINENCSAFNESCNIIHENCNTLHENCNESGNGLANPKKRLLSEGNNLLDDEDQAMASSKKILVNKSD